MKIIIETSELTQYLARQGVSGVSFQYVGRESLRVRKQIGSRIGLGSFSLPTELQLPLTLTVEGLIGNELAMRYDSWSLVNWILKAAVRCCGSKVEEYVEFHNPRSMIVHLGAIPKLRGMLAAAELCEIWFEDSPAGPLINIGARLR